MQLFRTFNIDFTVVPGVKDVKLYIDEECQQILVGDVHFGQFPQGEARDFDIYARNEGQIPTNIAVEIIGDTSWGSVVLVPDLTTTPEPVAPGEVLPFQIILNLSPDAVVDDFHTFEVRVTDGEPE